ncbi:FtsX-like permease family protein [Permianibacter sp. IMCC34836]|uniref:ADOP family duplicated permease n=1 Tax=Permianibacter fluminis TaxID=2738515 RepID=UPI001558315D|nr:ADOP family duplicated permease [Permianibacter fluminis]NQD38444.1 FtsX-like permease family protein [Permianibacter fluminis]
MWREIQYALRLLGKTPGFTALTLFVLAAGLGTAIYMYVLVTTLAYAKLPYPDSDRIVSAGGLINGKEQGGNSVGWYDFQQLSQSQTQFEQLALARNTHTMLSGIAAPRQIMTYNYSNSSPFEITAVPALLGRTLQPDDFTANAAPVTVLSWQVWQSDFNGDANVIGRAVKLDDEPATVVGVMPRDYAFPDTAQMWVPMRSGVMRPGGGPYGRLIGKLKADSSLSAADAELKTIAKRLEQQSPETNANFSFQLLPHTQQEMAGSMVIIALLIGAAIFILLLVVLNAGNLLLARAAERKKEISMRAALGAPRHRLVREMLWEALLLALGGGLIGLFFASWALLWSKQQFYTMANVLPFWWQFSFDSQTLWLALLLTVLTALGIGLYPALQASAGDLNRYLRDGSRGAQSLQLTRMTNVLVVTEIALSVALLIAALTLVASSRNIAAADYGARTNGVLTASLDLYRGIYDQPENMVRFSERLENDLANTPGIEAFALSCHVPGRYGPVWTYQVEGVDVPDRHYPSATRVVTSDQYFRLYGISLINGRLFDSRDQAESERVVIISARFAETNWPGQEAIGKRIDLGYQHADDARKWYTVIGVVGDVIYGAPQSDVATLPEFYLSFRQLPDEDMMISLATNGEPMALALPLTSAVQRIDADLPLQDIMSLSTRLDRSVAGLRFVANLFLAFAALGILLAGSGMYGVIARAVALRTQELGVRRALGAPEDHILLLLLRQGGLRFVIGSVIGVCLGLLMTQTVASILYAVDDARLLITVAVLLLVGALVATATLVPAWRAIRLSPASALRYE